MATVYNLCKTLILKGKTDGIVDKMDVYMANNRLTTEEYTELLKLLNPEE